MEFLTAYKRLDNLCKDLLGAEKGVGEYLTQMENCELSFANGTMTDDYTKLKKYRTVRNKIAHEDWANEEDMCTRADVRWLEDFYKRIIDRTDPLAQYRIRLERDEALARSRAKARRTAASVRRKDAEVSVKRTVEVSAGQRRETRRSVAYGLLTVFLITLALCAVAFLVSRLAA